MLYIEKNQRIPLPKKFHAANNLCAVVYDQLTEVIKDPIYQPIIRPTFNFSEQNVKNIDELIGGRIHPFDFFKENQMDNELETTLVKHITMSILGDFLNFVYESISCAQRGKMEVAYSLLRKPFIDELLIFEQILVDKTDFINRFFHIGNPKKYDPSNKEIDKKGIIQKSILKIKRKTNAHLSSELLYILRYDKNSPSGINGLSNRALHIVTTDQNYRTNNQELNFVFSNKEDTLQYWDHYYSFVPILVVA